MHKYSTIGLKNSMLLILLGVGLLSIVTLFLSGNRFIALSYENEKRNINEITHIKIRERLKLLREQNGQLASAVIKESGFKTALHNKNYDRIQQILNDQFFQYFITANVIDLKTIYLLTPEYKVLTTSTVGSQVLPQGEIICPDILDYRRLNSNADRVRIRSSLCEYNGRAYYIYITPVSTFKIPAYLMFVTSPSHTIREIEKEMASPIRITQPDGSVSYQSLDWPVGTRNEGTQIISHSHTEMLDSNNSEHLFHVDVAQDMQKFESTLTQTVYIGIMISVVTIAIGIFIAIIVLQLGMKSIKDIKKAGKIIEKGSYIPIKQTIFPDINDTVNAFNMMGERVSILIRQMKQAREDAEVANKVKSEFLANMSHEIRTPLTSIIGYAESLRDDELNQDQSRESINTIIQSGQHLRGIINDILDLSKIEANELTVEDIDVRPLETLNDIVSIFKRQAMNKGVEFGIDIKGDIPEVIKSDPIRLKQILLNMVSNALKFTSKGSITVFVSNDSANELLHFSCVDTGIGISESEQQHIFRAFAQANASTTREYGGTGLGLTLSRQLARMLGGDLTVKSEKNHGSTFTLSVATGSQKDTGTVSNRDFTPTEVDFHAPVNPESRVSGDILLVEDTPALQDLVSMYITRMGATPHIVGNGGEAVEMALQRPYDLILMDIQMPIMDGKEAVKILRATGYSGPILAMTAHAMRGDLEEYMKIGFDDYITKPVDRKRFINMISGYLEENAQSGSSNSVIASEGEIEDDDFQVILKRFVEALPRFQNDMKLAFETGDWETLTRTAHSLKGTGGGYGYPQLSDLARLIETAGKKHSETKLKEYFAQLDEMIQRIQSGFH